MALFPRHHLKTFRCLSAGRNFHSAIQRDSLRPRFLVSALPGLPASATAPAQPNANITFNRCCNASWLQIRWSSSENRSLPTVMDFPTIVWPSVFKTIKNWILVNFIIRPYFDQEFSLNDFASGSKQAAEVVSASLGTVDMKALQGLVSSEAIDELRATISRMSLTQRGEIPINKEDIYLSFPYQVGIIFDESDEAAQKRWVEITMVFHVLRGLQEMRENGVVPPLNIGMHPEYRNRISICNYRFIKEFTQGSESDWTINVVNHFKPADDLDDEN